MAPYEMTRGSATSDDQFAYFTPSGTSLVYRYQWSTEVWNRLPSCPQRDAGLAIVSGELVAVGGKYISYYTNKLFTLRSWKKWVEEYPPMNTERSCPAVIAASGYIITIGGYAGIWTSSVELLNICDKFRVWSEICGLRPLRNPSALICGEELYVIESDLGSQGYSYSLSHLSHSSPSHLTQFLKLLPPLPVDFATVTSLHGNLVLIGGEQHGSLANSIYQLKDEYWVEVGRMNYARKNCLAANISDRRGILIVGGIGGQGVKSSVEEFVG